MVNAQMDCLYYGCKNKALDCDTFCDKHRSEYGLYQPQTYVQAYNKAKAAYERTGDKYFVYRHNHLNRCHKGYGTARVNQRNWINAIFSCVIFPVDESVISVATAQKAMFWMLHGEGVE